MEDRENKTPKNNTEKQDDQKEQSNQNQPDNQEEYSDTPNDQQINNMGNLLSPEGVIMLLVAFTLDAIGFLLIILAIDDFGITDIIGIITIGTWGFIKTGSAPNKNIKAPTTGTEGSIKLAKGNPFLKRFTVAGITEIIPYLGSIVPAWTIIVCQTLLEID